MKSKRFSLNGVDYMNVGKNILTFVAPDFIVFLGALQLKFQAQEAFLAVLGVNILIDILKKFVGGKK